MLKNRQQYNLFYIPKIVEKYSLQIKIIIEKTFAGFTLCRHRGFLRFSEFPFKEFANAKWRVKKLSLTLSIYPERLEYRMAFPFFSRGIRSLRNGEWRGSCTKPIMDRAENIPGLPIDDWPATCSAVCK